jgi:hypothetical protein
MALVSHYDRSNSSVMLTNPESSLLTNSLFAENFVWRLPVAGNQA